MGRAIGTVLKHDEEAADTDAATFVSLLTAQRDVYVRLKGLVDRQRSLVERDDPTELLSLLAERRRLTDDLTSLARRLGPIEPQWAKLKGAVSDEEGGRVRTLLGEVRDVLGHITAVDSEDVRRLEVRRRRVSTAMREIPAGQEMLAAYGKSAPARPANVDRTDTEL